MNDASNQTRRDFIKRSAGVVAASAAATSVLRVPGAYAAADETVKIALVGCGGRGAGATVNALSSASGPVKLVAVADAFEDNARNAVNNLKNQGEVGDKVDVAPERIFHGFDAYQRVLETNPDVVILATPPGFRPMHFEAAVKAGKHVFMEKPVAVDAAGVRKVLETAKLAKEKNLKVGVGLQRHHDPKYIEGVQRVRDGAIGKLQLLRVYWNDDGVWVRARKPGMTEMEYQMRNWYYFNWLCGDHINEQHIHNLDVGNWVMGGPPVSAQGQGGRQVLTGIDHGEIFDHHMVEYTYADGTKMLSQCRHQPGCWKSVSEHVHGTTGTAELNSGRITGGGGNDWKFAGKGGRNASGNPYDLEHVAFFDAIRNNKDFNEAENGAHSTMTAVMGRMATYSGQMIEWDKALNSQLATMPEKLGWDAKPPTTPDENGRYPIPTPGQTKVM